MPNLAWLIADQLGAGSASATTDVSQLLKMLRLKRPYARAFEGNGFAKAVAVPS